MSKVNAATNRRQPKQRTANSIHDLEPGEILRGLEREFKAQESEAKKPVAEINAALHAVATIRFGWFNGDTGAHQRAIADKVDYKIAEEFDPGTYLEPAELRSRGKGFEAAIRASFAVLLKAWVAVGHRFPLLDIALPGTRGRSTDSLLRNQVAVLTARGLSPEEVAATIRRFRNVATPAHNPSTAAVRQMIARERADKRPLIMKQGRLEMLYSNGSAPDYLELDRYRWKPPNRASRSAGKSSARTVSGKRKRPPRRQGAV